MKAPFFKSGLLLAAMSSAMLVGCGGSSSSSNDEQPKKANPLDLTILHMNDHHSHLDESKQTLTINGSEYKGKSGGFPRVVTAFKNLESKAGSNVLKLHSGDAITGTLYYTLFKGEADAAMMNEVCFDAFALGNHEFDDSDAGLKTFLDFLNPSSNAKCPATPVLAANVVPKVGTPLAAAKSDDYIKPYVIKEVGGEKVGLVGIDIASKTKNSSSPLETTEFKDEVTSAQAAIDALEAQGVNKIILMTHYQYKNDLAMVPQLSGVDVVVGGDSHTLLGDFSQYGLNSAGAYPTKLKDKAGNETCVVQAWQYAQVVGELKVSFDADGKVISCNGTPHLLVGAPYEKDGNDISDVDKQTAIAALANIPNIALTEPDAGATANLKVFADQKEQKAKEKIGSAAENLCLERIPGQGKSKLCSADETKPHGGDIQMLVSHAFRNMAKEADIAIQNAGGVRVDVAAGDVTTETAYTLLPFANTLVTLKMTGAEIKTVLEEAVDYALDENGSTGAYPYAAGLRWDMDLSQAKGSRLSNLQYKGRDASSWMALNMSQTFTVVTNNYIAGGKDGYLTFATIKADASKYEDTFLDYAQSFSDYVKAQAAQNKSLTKLPYSEYSTQNFTAKDGSNFATKAQ